MSGQGSQDGQALQPLRPATRTVIVDGSSFLLPKVRTFVFWQFSSSPRDAASDIIVSNVAWQVE